MNAKVLTGALVAMSVVLLAGVSYARNPNCSGGILYLSQAMKDKERGNLDDYHREILLAVDRLQLCSDEDGKDFEAIGYLAWAYAEVDSAERAGKAFQRAIEGLKAKGDKKKVAWAQNNRESYWATAFNDGIAKINSAQTAYPDLSREPTEEADKSLKREAEKLYGQALTSLTRAAQLKPGDPRTIRNLGTTHAFMGDYLLAETILKDGLTIAPNDSDLVAALSSVQGGAALKLVAEAKYDEAIVYYERLVKETPGDGGLWMGLADAHFKRAQTREGAARADDFKKAGAAFAKAGTIRTDDADLPFNAALAFQNAGEFGLSELQWRAALKQRPDDPDALSALGSALAEQGKFDEAVKAVHRAVQVDPKNKSRHRQLGAVYTRAGNNAKATEELMVYLALQGGTSVSDVASQVKQAPGGSDAAKAAADMGAPEDVFLWEADGEKYESWFYWAKGVAQHFKAGAKVQRSDWSAADTKAAK